MADLYVDLKDFEKCPNLNIDYSIAIFWKKIILEWLFLAIKQRRYLFKSATIKTCFICMEKSLELHENLDDDYTSPTTQRKLPELI